MNKMHIRNLGLLLLLGVAGCGRPWVRVDVDTHVEAQLPNTPQVLGMATDKQQGKLYSTTDDVALYQILRMTFTDSTASFAGPQARQDFYNDAARTLLHNQQGSLLVHRRSFATRAGEGMELEFTALHQGTKERVTKYNRSLLVGRVGYSFSFIPHHGMAPLDRRTDEQRSRFFASITVK